MGEIFRELRSHAREEFRVWVCADKGPTAGFITQVHVKTKSQLLVANFQLAFWLQNLNLNLNDISEQ